jgi:polysaccharide pyruvyl transferase WcaK-like protein
MCKKTGQTFACPVLQLTYESKFSRLAQDVKLPVRRR